MYGVMQCNEGNQLISELGAEVWVTASAMCANNKIISLKCVETTI